MLPIIPLRLVALILAKDKQNNDTNRQRSMVVTAISKSIRELQRLFPHPSLQEHRRRKRRFLFRRVKGDSEQCWWLTEGNLWCDKRHACTQLYVIGNVSTAKLEGNQNSTRKARIQWDEGIKAWKTWVNITKLSSDGNWLHSVASDSSGTEDGANRDSFIIKGKYWTSLVEHRIALGYVLLVEETSHWWTKNRIGNS